MIPYFGISFDLGGRERHVLDSERENTMTDTQPRKDQFLGEIQTRIAGMQYVEGEVGPGETVYLERDFQNQHDEKAIRVKNVDFVDAGFVPRDVCSWLSPLWDEGKIFVDGYIPLFSHSVAQGRHQGSPLALLVYLTPKGRYLLEKKPVIQSEPDAVQDILLSIHQNLAAYSSLSIVQAIQERLQRIAQRDATPESRLLLSLLPGAYRQLDKNKSCERIQRIKEFFQRLKPLNGIACQNLTLFPIPAVNGSVADYALLDSAMRCNDVELEEVSQSGNVHEILLNNKGSKPVLLPEGEILIGAKQNRVLNITILVAAQSRTRIPVSCVERGRWHYSTEKFAETTYAHPKLRGKKMRSVHACRAQTGEARSDQGEVWEEVSQKLHEMQEQSPTESLVDGIRTTEERINEYRRQIQLPEETAGVIVCSGERVVGFDYFGKPEHFQAYWEKLSNSYFMDTLNTEPSSETADESPTSNTTGPLIAHEFLEKLTQGLDLYDPPVGLGDEFMIQVEGITGTGVWYEGEMCHFSGFEG